MSDSPLLPFANTAPYLFPVDGMMDIGKTHAERYNGADPFPHIVLDDFVMPSALDMCLEGFPQEQSRDSQSFDRDQERFKTSHNPDHLSSSITALFHAFNSRPFLDFLEGLTGIEGLIPDPHFIGGGFHEIRQGGHLSVHADFNHHRILNLERRINLLIYLNKDWKEEYGGQLELWDNDMKNCLTSVVPEFNRAVIFNTTSHSNHGNPNPINHPEGVPRRSIALYYYTATWSDEKMKHTTLFRPREGTEDKTDFSVKSDIVVRELLPPFLYRGYAKIRNKLK